MHTNKKIDLKHLEEALKNNSDVSLSAMSRERIRNNILRFSRLKESSEEFGFAGVIEKIRGIASKIYPRDYFRVLLKEKLITLVDFQSSRKFRLFEFPRISKRFGAALVTFLFVAGLLLNFTVGVDRAEASLATTLKEISGEVLIIRDGLELIGSSGFVLKPDDVVKTGGGSSAAIQFLDESVSRLDENTEIKISKLFRNPVDSTETSVELVLNQGRMWARVINLVDSFSHFQVKADNAVAVAKNKAAFDVAILANGKAKVSAIQNKVDLVVAADRKIVETSITNGFSAEIKENGNNSPRIKEEPKKDDDKWVETNLAADKIYIETVKQQAQEKLKEGVKILPGNPFYAVKELSNSTEIALTIDEVSKQKKKISVALEKFAEAQVMLEKGDKDRAADLLAEFKKIIQGVFNWTQAKEAENPAEAHEVKIKVEEALKHNQKALALVLPSDPLYLLKESVADVKVLIASDPVRKTEEQMNQASEILFEAHELAEQGDSAGAAAQVEEYSRKVSDAVSEVGGLPDDTKGRAVSVILDTKAEDLKVLEAIIVTPATGTTVPPREAETTSTTADNIAGPETGDGSTTVNVIPGTVSPATEVGSDTQQIADSEEEPSISSPAAEQEANENERQRSREFKKTLSDAKTDTLERLGEAVADSQKERPSVDVLQKLQEIQRMDLNGRPLMDMRLMNSRVFIQSGRGVIYIGRPAATGTSSLESQQQGTATPAMPSLPAVMPRTSN